MFYVFLEHKNYFLMAFSFCKVTLECHEDVLFVLFSASLLQLFSCKSNMFFCWPTWSELFLCDLNGLFFVTSMVFSLWPPWSFLCDLNGLFLFDLNGLFNFWPQWSFFLMWLAQLDNHPLLSLIFRIKILFFSCKSNTQ